MARSLAVKIPLACLITALLMLQLSAQEKGTDGLKPKKPEKSRSPRTNRPKAAPSASYGFLTIVGPPGARIEVHSLDPAKKAEPLNNQIPAGATLINLEKIEAGKYRISLELDGYVEADGRNIQVVEVAGNRLSTVIFNMKPVTHAVRIKTNAPTGNIYYASQGESVKRMVAFSNGQIELPALRGGLYEVEIQPNDPVYQPHRGSIRVSQESTSFEIPLTVRKSSGPFLPRWTSLDGWEAPAGWTVSEMKLLARGQGIGLPTDSSVRHYDNFKLIANVKMLNDMAVSLVLRAQDKRNYYLLQVTGGAADEKYVARIFVVRDGVERRLPNILAVTDQSISRDFFTLTIECLENRFKVDILTPDGNSMPLGELIDAAKTFSIGAPGIAVRSNEESVIELFHVSITNGPGQ